jgi:putative DNA methylase
MESTADKGDPEKRKAGFGPRAIETGIPLAPLHELSKVESYNKHLYRPSAYLHKWWARRLGSVFRTILLGTFSPATEDLWQRYYQGARFPDRIVLDPFMGGGTTVHEALRLGCKVIGVDYNPVAWWMVRSSITLPDLDRLADGFLTLQKRAAPSLLSYYTTHCPKCAEQGYAAFLLWVRTAKCERCSTTARLHESFVLRTDGEVKTVVCPHCRRLFETKARDAAQCSGCGHRVDLQGGVADNGQYSCPACHHLQRVPRGAITPDLPDQFEMFAVRYVCPRHGEGFKTADAADIHAYQMASDHFLKVGDSLPVPDQAIPDGWKTGDLLAHDYVKWRDLFNPRQLLCAGTLLKEILRVPDRNVREAFVTLFSACLEFNNALCTYKGGSARRPGAVRHIFSHHAFVFPYEMLENNFWGVGAQSGTFTHLYSSRLCRAKEFCLLPREREVREGRTVRTVSLPGESVKADLAENFAQLANGAKNAWLLCGSSEELPIPDKSVDAVVTDPPYSDNVQYAELSDFFYVWQRQALKGSHPEFRSALVRKDREIVKNPKQGKDGSFYEDGLRRVYSECRRVLKDDGLLVFTFHHKAFEAWVNVLKAVLDAGFFVTAAYPVHSEMPLSVHIQGCQSISYDAVLVCRKRMWSAPSSWADVEDEIRVQASRALQELSGNGQHLSNWNCYVVILGKCLECYSLHFPEVVDEDGLAVSVKWATARMMTLAKDMLGGQASGGGVNGGTGVLRADRVARAGGGR